MLLLLSPAKSLDFSSPISCQKHSLPIFATAACSLVLQLKKLDSKDLEKLMKISKKLAELNFERFQNFSEKFSAENSRQALLAFDGDVYSKIEKSTFGAKDFDFAQDKIAILSGLYGLLRPLDLIQPYRLEMGCNFKISGKSLYQFWEEKLARELENRGCSAIINLASEEYFGAVNPQKISKKIINIVFKEKKAGALKIVGINAKKARGAMANFVIKNRIEKFLELKDFREEDYRFEKKLSDEENWVFVR
jgi:cytoplasmic iron level regulating protein YaaA (DUF328/UPF0246 family)